MDIKGTTAPARDGTPTTLHVPLASASAADNALAHSPGEHHWSVLAAILLIVAAVAWSLLRQRRGNARKG